MSEVGQRRLGDGGVGGDARNRGRAAHEGGRGGGQGWRKQGWCKQGHGEVADQGRRVATGHDGGD